MIKHSDFRRPVSKGTMLVAGLGVCVLAAGCTGTSTYGTGKSQEAQLLEDLTGILALGGRKERKKINYSARPKLVPPPTAQALPAPAGEVDGEAGYFPQNPEERLQQNLQTLSDVDARGGELPSEIVAARKASAARQSTNINAPHPDRDITHDYSNEQATREAVLRQRARLSGNAGSGPRRYLTEPPREYRTPADTAPIGVVGEKEEDPKIKKNKPKKSLWKTITGG